MYTNPHFFFPGKVLIGGVDYVRGTFGIFNGYTSSKDSDLVCLGLG